MKRIAILASGGGSNALKIMEYFRKSEVAEVVFLSSNRAEAGALEKASSFGVETSVHSLEDRENGALLQSLIDRQVDLLVLAGYLKKIGEDLIQAFPGKIVNIHPALLPKYGGKGMYGMHVHRAVKEANETESGMTIHLVNEQYDEGAIIRQESVKLDPADSAEAIAKKVLELEHRWFAPTIEQILKTENENAI